MTKKKIVRKKSKLFQEKYPSETSKQCWKAMEDYQRGHGRVSLSAVVLEFKNKQYKPREKQGEIILNRG